MKLIKAVGVVAVSVFATAAMADYSEHPEAIAFKPDLLESGFTEAEIDAFLAGAEKKQSIIDAISKPAERVLEWKDYRKIFITERRLNEGLDFMREQADTLARAERELGVPAEIIAAIIGVETYYGRITGSYRVIDALTTLAFDYPKRASFFKKQLREYLMLAKEQGVDPMEPKGSYAGAMGYGQFMPSSYRAYAIDFDDDQFTDIWTNPVDAIGSVGHYLKRHGWVPGQPIMQELSDAERVSSEWLTSGLKLDFTVGELPINRDEIAASLPADTKAKIIELQAESGSKQWVVFNNFYTITRYNHSSMYAMAVTQLAQSLAQGLLEP